STRATQASSWSQVWTRRASSMASTRLGVAPTLTRWNVAPRTVTVLIQAGRPRFRARSARARAPAGSRYEPSWTVKRGLVATALGAGAAAARAGSGAAAAGITGSGRAGSTGVTGSGVAAATAGSAVCGSTGSAARISWAVTVAVSRRA